MDVSRSQSLAHTRLIFVLMIAAMFGCASREPIGNFSSEGLPPFSDSGITVPADRWWMELGDNELDARVEQAFEGNYDLAAALQRVAAARAVARRQASDFFPDLDGVVSTQSIFGPGEDRFPSVIGLEANYIVDLWGQVESRVDAERFRASATYADYQAVALAVAAEVTRTWLSLIEANAQLELLDDQIETNRTGLELQEARFGLGLVRSPDVLRQRQLLESTFEQYTVVQARVEVLEHQLAVLLGEMPQFADYNPGTELPELPPLPSTGLPAELLNRRPDVRREYLAFVAADRDLAAAVSDQFPRLNLTGSFLNVADQPSNLFRDWFLSIGSSLVAPLLDGGQRRAEVRRNQAVTRQRFNEYGSTMLIAFGEVEDSLARERYQLQRLKHLNAQVELARQSSEQLREQYLIGDEDYLAVLTALTAWQRLQRETLSAQLELRLIRVSLYMALAGGIDPRVTVMPMEVFVETDASEPQTEEVNEVDETVSAAEMVSDLETLPPGEAELSPTIDPGNSLQPEDTLPEPIATPVRLPTVTETETNQ
ncbi:TolC family protein [Aporhodopirellula aestuarii]|uniref:TolC family protein n=1 Tax=Aporhodopirellula aestuarii TaxID=2950107 RepID=A0ABT0TZ09_9BACT|nr:TolC family protein [Aporhodopirellula aestuarii]MCM2369816.1 TolC family protein [Aporhodopirellula aestuarii]